MEGKCGRDRNGKSTAEESEGIWMWNEEKTEGKWTAEWTVRGIRGEMRCNQLVEIYDRKPMRGIGGEIS